MKTNYKYFLLGFLVMFLFTFIMGLYDDAFKAVYPFDNWYQGILASFEYYFLWVLPYWWLVILIGSVVIGLLFYGIGIGIEKLRDQSPQ